MGLSQSRGQEPRALSAGIKATVVSQSNKVIQNMHNFVFPILSCHDGAQVPISNDSHFICERHCLPHMVQTGKIPPAHEEINEVKE